FGATRAWDYRKWTDPRDGDTTVRSRPVHILAFFLGTVSCSSRSSGLPEEATMFANEDGGSTDECPRQCWFDLQSAVRSCDNSLVTTCPEGLGCSEGECVPGCASASKAKSSIGCEFYFQPLADGEAAKSCYALYLTNAWNSPVSFALDVGGEK